MVFIIMIFILLVISSRCYASYVTFKSGLSMFIYMLISSKWFTMTVIFSTFFSFTLGIILSSSLFQGMSYSFSRFYIYLFFIYTLMLLFDQMFKENLMKKMVGAVLYGKSITKTTLVMIDLPALILTGFIVWVSIYNLYDMGANGTIFFSMDSDFIIRMGKHRIGSVHSYFYMDTRSENFYLEIMNKMDKMFNHHVNLYPWLCHQSPYEKHKILCWISERLYWCQEYHCNQSNLPFDQQRWEVIKMELQMIKINFISFNSNYVWRHDPYDLDVPTGSNVHPRIVIKWYQN